jgi:hypothetical protein
VSGNGHAGAPSDPQSSPAAVASHWKLRAGTNNSRSPTEARTLADGQAQGLSRCAALRALRAHAPRQGAARDPQETPSEAGQQAPAIGDCCSQRGRFLLPLARFSPRARSARCARPRAQHTKRQNRAARGLARGASPRRAGSPARDRAAVPARKPDRYGRRGAPVGGTRNGIAYGSLAGGKRHWTLDTGDRRI